MARWEQEEHQPEPWTYDERSILSVRGWRLAKAVLVPDARRIVAAANDTLGIPTPALEAGFIRDLLELRIWPRDGEKARRLYRPAAADPAEYFLNEPIEPTAPFPYDRRIGERRRRRKAP